MRRIPLFWKNWMFSTVVVFMVISGTFAFTAFGMPYIEQLQTDKAIEARLDELANNIKQNGFDAAVFADLSKNGYIVEVRKNGAVQYQTIGWVESRLYYTYEHEMTIYGETMEVTSMIPIEYHNYSAMESYSGDYQELPIRTNDLRSSEFDFHERVFLAGDDSYVIQLVDATTYYSIKDAAYKSAYFLEESFLLFVIATLLIASLLSLFIAWLIGRRVKKLEKIVNNMRLMQEPERDVYQKGDELVCLENQVYQMYGKLRQTIRELDDEVVYTKKLEEDKQLFMRGATHELKTPIMAMNAMIEGMMNNVGNYQEHEVYLKKCYNHLQQIQKLVNEILAVSKTEHLNYHEATAILPLIEESKRLYQEIDEYVVIDSINESSKEVQLMMPADSFRKIISNLLSNAIYYRMQGTPVTITITDSKISICNMLPPDTEIDVNTIFKPFVSGTSEMTAGHGLGLYIVQLLLERYGYRYECIVDNEKHVFCFAVYV